MAMSPPTILMTIMAAIGKVLFPVVAVESPAVADPPGMT